MSETLQLPKCSKCGQTDDHPRHIVLRVLDVSNLAPAGTDAETLARLEAVYNTQDHIDCCTCDNEPAVKNSLNGLETCAQLLSRTNGLKGQELRDHLVENPRQVNQEG